MRQVRIRGIRKDFSSRRRGKVCALAGVDLDIEPGAFFVLLGPSGCGKSTLLNIIAGIEKPTGGEIWIGDRLVVSTPQKRFISPQQRDVAMVFQNYALYPHMTVLQNLAFPLRVARLRGVEVRQRVERIAQLLDLAGLLNARPAELSGGQRQRVALGRAIVREPDVLLLDEPLSNLDAALRTTMRAELRRLQRRLHVTTLYVTHDQTEAMSLADQIAVLAGGAVQQVGAPAEIYSDPCNLFVARFVGALPINILDGERCACLVSRGTTSQRPDQILAGLRPEHARITAFQQGKLQATLEFIADLGGTRLLHLDAAGTPLLVREPEGTALHEGARIGVDFDEKDLLLFDKHSGVRLRG